MGLAPSGLDRSVPFPPPFWARTPIVSSKVIALMLREARMASLSANVGSSLDGTLADRITHMSHKFTFTARKSARLKGEPCAQIHTLKYILTVVFYLECSTLDFGMVVFAR